MSSLDRFDKFSTVHLAIYDTLTKKSPTLCYLQKVSQIGEGGSFGERSLLKNDERAASIVCSTDCHFATLSR